MPAPPRSIRLTAIVCGLTLLAIAALATAGMFRGLRFSWREDFLPQRMVAKLRDVRTRPHVPQTRPVMPRAQRQSRPALAGILLNLDHVDRNSENYARFRDWVDSAVAGSPGTHSKLPTPR